jgi:hypothetical protein
MVETTPATADEITAIIGHIDEVLLADILRTGAAAAELAQAFALLEADDAPDLRTRDGTPARVCDLMALLQAAQFDPQENGR